MDISMYMQSVRQNTKKTTYSAFFDHGSLCQILLAVTHALETLHKIGLTHWDVKPENLLWTTGKTPTITSDGYIKLSGMPGTCPIKLCDMDALSLSDNQNLCNASPQGRTTASYTAPEVLENPMKSQITGACDMWSLGVILFIFCYGGVFGINLDENCRVIQNFVLLIDEVSQQLDNVLDVNLRLSQILVAGLPDLKEKCIPMHVNVCGPDGCSSMWRELIINLLEVDPDKRWTAKKVIERISEFQVNI